MSSMMGGDDEGGWKVNKGTAFLFHRGPGQASIVHFRSCHDCRQVGRSFRARNGIS